MRYAIGVVFLFLVVLGLVLSGQWGRSAAQVTPLLEGRVIMVAENLDIPGQTVTTAFFDTDDCRTVTVFVDSDIRGLTVSVYPSVFGIFMPARITGSKFERVVGKSVTYFGDFLVAPMLAVEFERSDTTTTGTINGAWLFCTH